MPRWFRVWLPLALLSIWIVDRPVRPPTPTVRLVDQVSETLKALGSGNSPGNGVVVGDSVTLGHQGP